jgi:hypothetical protein
MARSQLLPEWPIGPWLVKTGCFVDEAFGGAAPVV